jgi:hypothetical protein
LDLRSTQTGETFVIFETSREIGACDLETWTESREIDPSVFNARVNERKKYIARAKDVRAHGLSVSGHEHEYVVRVTRKTIVSEEVPGRSVRYARCGKNVGLEIGGVYRKRRLCSLDLEKIEEMAGGRDVVDFIKEGKSNV